MQESLYYKYKEDFSDKISKMFEKIDELEKEIKNINTVEPLSLDIGRLMLTCIINSYMICSWAGGKDYAKGLSDSTVFQEGSSAS